MLDRSKKDAAERKTAARTGYILGMGAMALIAGSGVWWYGDAFLPWWFKVGAVLLLFLGGVVAGKKA